MVRRRPEDHAAPLLIFCVIDVAAEQILQRRHELLKEHVGPVFCQRCDYGRLLGVPELREGRRRVAALQLGVVKRGFVHHARIRFPTDSRLPLGQGPSGGEAFREQKLVAKVQVHPLVAVNDRREVRLGDVVVEKRLEKRLDFFHETVCVLLRVQLPERGKPDDLHRVPKCHLGQREREAGQRAALHAAVSRKMPAIGIQTQDVPNLVARIQLRRAILGRDLHLLQERLGTQLLLIGLLEIERAVVQSLEKVLLANLPPDFVHL
mmetsp:Transcript_17762/g.45093  ORF Transcript_17762/g.45093 Transcript_17762/m.45093 type:complete len:264 (-) Transcript_17762:1303-2094(-)